MTATATPALGPLEMSVLGLLTEAPLSVGDVQEKLRGQGQDLAYTTVMTVLVRLLSKGWVVREKQGRQFMYAPARQAGTLRDSLLAKVKRALFAHDRLRPIVALLGDDAHLSRAELLQLRQLVDAKLKERKAKGE